MKIDTAKRIKIIKAAIGVIFGITIYLFIKLLF